MTKPYYVGSYKKDGLEGPNRGWIVGKFIDEAPRKNEKVEIKYWEYTKGETTSHPTKVSSIIDCTFILKGRTKAIINNEELILSAGDYVVIQPGVSNNTVVEILEDSVGLTVKAPSEPTAKKELD